MLKSVFYFLGKKMGNKRKQTVQKDQSYFICEDLARVRGEGVDGGY
jgi:hypothetical protein